MNFNDKLFAVISLFSLLSASTISAPVKSGDLPNLEESAKFQNDENTAKELEELSKTGHIVLPAAPVVAKVTEDLNTATNDKEQIADQEKESVDDINESVELPTSKRQFPTSGGFPASNRQLPVLPTGFDDLSAYPGQLDVDLSPRAVAEYLLVTADFSGFDQALDDLLETGILSSSEIQQYKDSVSREYENLLQQVSQAESEYLQELSRVSPMDYFNTIQKPVRLYPEYPYNQNSLEYSDVDLDSYRDQMPSLLKYGDQVVQNYQQDVPDYQDKSDQQVPDERLVEKEPSLGDILNDMLNEYYGDQTRGGQDVEYDIEVPEDISNYESVNDGDDIGDNSNTNDNDNNNNEDDHDNDDHNDGDDDDDDDEIKQFMAYLQQTLVSEQAGAGIIEIPDAADERKKPEKTEQIGGSDGDVARELDDLSLSEGEDGQQQQRHREEDEQQQEEEEHSGEIDQRKRPSPRATPHKTAICVILLSLFSSLYCLCR